MSFHDIATLDPSEALSSDEASVYLDAFTINMNVMEIRSTAAQLGTSHDSRALRARLRYVTERTRELLRRRMHAIVSDFQHGPATRILTSDFDVAVRNFQAAQRLSGSLQRANVIPGPAVEPLVDLSDATQTQIMDAASRQAEIAERLAAIQELERGITDVADTIRQLENIFERQGAEAYMLERNSERTAMDLEHGASALHRQSRSRWMWLIIVFGVVLVVAVLGATRFIWR
ncbi:hypothetical protein DFH06DRAFT_1471303 [Mycena polygramma]|nr:hypothetical protein DFH06DRAFT_1471303 [Mycena polygramma]